MVLKKSIQKIYYFFKKRRIKRAACISGKLTINSATEVINKGCRKSVAIGNHCCLLCKIYCFENGKISIGENNYIGTSTYLLCKEKIIIGNSVIIANDVIIADNNTHPIDPVFRAEMSKCDDFLRDDKWSCKHSKSSPIIIEDNVWICRRAMIMKGVIVGRGSIVGAGAVVTHNVPPYTIVAGNPAKVVKTLDDAINVNNNK